MGETDLVGGSLEQLDHLLRAVGRLQRNLGLAVDLGEQLESA
jgi:hypothetical protein